MLKHIEALERRLDSVESGSSYNHIEMIKLTDNSKKFVLTLATHEKLIETVHIDQDASRRDTETQPAQLVQDSGNGGEIFEVQPTMDTALVRPRPRQHESSPSMLGRKDVVGPPLPLPAVWPTLHGRFPGDQRPLADSNQFSVPQLEYTLGGTSKMGSDVYFLLIVAMVLLL